MGSFQMKRTVKPVTTRDFAVIVSNPPRGRFWNAESFNVPVISTVPVMSAKFVQLIEGLAEFVSILLIHSLHLLVFFPQAANLLLFCYDRRFRLQPWKTENLREFVAMSVHSFQLARAPVTSFFSPVGGAARPPSAGFTPVLPSMMKDEYGTISASFYRRGTHGLSSK